MDNKENKSLLTDTMNNNNNSVHPLNEETDQEEIKELTADIKNTFIIEIKELCNICSYDSIINDKHVHTRICSILDKYQEYAELLDPHLELIITNLFNVVQQQIVKSHATSLELFAKRALVGDNVNVSMNANIDMHLLGRISQIFYTLAKVRGSKTISITLISKHMFYVFASKFFPHEVADLEPVLSILICVSVGGHGKNYELWQIRYTLLLWLSIIIIIPFDLTSVDSSLTFGSHISNITSNTTNNSSTNNQIANNVADTHTTSSKGLIVTLVNVGKQYLADTGPTREASSYMLSKLLTRPDMCGQPLTDYLEWCIYTLAKSNPNVFLTTGIVRSLCEIYKHAPRSVLVEKTNIIYQYCITNKPYIKSTSGLLRKLQTKLIQRIGVALLKPTVATWRYNRGHRSLEHTLQQSNTNTEQKNDTAQQNNDNVEGEGEGEGEDEIDIPDQIEEIIEQLLYAVKDTDTIVRWSAAKGLGRITSGLPQSFSDEVVHSILELFSGRESSNSWHGGCLTLAELSRRGLLLPSRLSEVVNVVQRALMYDVRVGTYSVGAHVRDGACYVVWAFARAYAPSVMTQYVHQLSTSLLTLCVYDREVNVRRASAAAFQEHVGRQGNFPHGIEINTHADYFTLGNRNNAYTNISVFIAQYQEYRQTLIDHLITHKSKHWDIYIRTLTAQTLFNLTEVTGAAEYMSEAVLPSLVESIKSNDLCERHGSICCIAEIVRKLFEIKHSISSNILDSILNIPVKMSTQSIFGGKGGQLMRECVCTLIRTFALCRIHASYEQICTWHKIIEDNMQHTHDDVQTAAVSAYHAFTRTYYPSIRQNTQDDTLPYIITDWQQYIFKYIQLIRTSDQVGTTRGLSLSLSVLPKHLLCISQTQTQIQKQESPQPLCMIVDALIHSASPTQSDAETRRNSIKALSVLATTVDEVILCPYTQAQSTTLTHTPKIDTEEKENDSKTTNVSSPAVTVKDTANKHNIVINDIASAMINAYICGLDDYATDNRGDIGSWIREQSMHAITHILVQLTNIQHKLGVSNILSVNMVELCMCGLMQQVVEKIDRVRAVAGNNIHKLIHTQPHIPHIPHHQHLQQTIQKDATMDWSSSASVFTLCVPLLSLDKYQLCILRGLVISVGGLTENVLRYSSEQLINFMAQAAEIDSANGDIKCIESIGNSMLSVLNEYKGQYRVIIPAFKCIQLLLDNSLFDSLTPDKSRFAHNLHERVWREVCNSPNINKVLSSLNVFLGLVSFQTPIRTYALQALTGMLSHEYPKLRRMAGECLYAAMSKYDDVCTDQQINDSILSLLEQTAWDGSLEISSRASLSVCSLLKVEPYKLKPLKTKIKSNQHNNTNMNQQQSSIDQSAESGGYGALIRNMDF